MPKLFSFTSIQLPLHAEIINRKAKSPRHEEDLKGFGICWKIRDPSFLPRHEYNAFLWCGVAKSSNSDIRKPFVITDSSLVRR